jgi:hypothetical protein
VEMTPRGAGLMQDCMREQGICEWYCHAGRGVDAMWRWVSAERASGHLLRWALLVMQAVVEMTPCGVGSVQLGNFRQNATDRRCCENVSGDAQILHSLLNLMCSVCLRISMLRFLPKPRILTTSMKIIRRIAQSVIAAQ